MRFAVSALRVAAAFRLLSGVFITWDLRQRLRTEDWITGNLWLESLASGAAEAALLLAVAAVLGLLHRYVIAVEAR